MGDIVHRLVLALLPSLDPKSWRAINSLFFESRTSNPFLFPFLPSSPPLLFSNDVKKMSIDHNPAILSPIKATVATNTPIMTTLQFSSHVSTPHKTVSTPFQAPSFPLLREVSLNREVAPDNSPDETTEHSFSEKGPARVGRKVRRRVVKRKRRFPRVSKIMLHLKILRKGEYC